MNQPLKLAFFILAATTLAVASCRKTDVTQTRLTRIQHTWKLVKNATDANANGIIDASEIHPLDASMNNTIVFNSDFTGKETVVASGVSTEYPFTWVMDYHMDTITRNGVGHNQIKYYLEDITSISMTLTTMTDLGIAGYYYEKK